MPENLSYIGDEAFRNCERLISISLPASCETIGYLAFFGCRGLETVTVDANNSVFDSRENCNAIIETETNKVVVGCKNTVLPSSIKILGANCFAFCSPITSITLNHGLERIEEGAFNCCLNLTSITIPNTVKYIGRSAIAGCYYLESITFEENSQLEYIGECAFAECGYYTESGLMEEISIPESVNTIMFNAFGWEQSIQNIIFESDADWIATMVDWDNEIWDYAETDTTVTIYHTQLNNIETATEYASTTYAMYNWRKIVD